MTRGRSANHAYVVVEDNQTPRDVLTQAITREWIDLPALARRAQLDPHLVRQLTPAGPGKDHDPDELDEMERHVRRLIAERQARTRQIERSLGRSL